MEKTKILYNADCPVCRFEIDHYRSYASKEALPMRFDDLNGEEMANWDLTPDQAARRLHVLHGGTLYAGIPAFLVLWAEMPRYHWLGRVVGLPGVRHLAIFVYDWLLAPAIYRWHLIRQKRKAPAEADA